MIGRHHEIIPFLRGEVEKRCLSLPLSIKGLNAPSLLHHCIRPNCFSNSACDMTTITGLPCGQ
jgi:hypothetical protein